MASTSTVQHRFANKDYNFEKGLKGSSVHIDGKNYYSYSTVFGQWVDEKVCIVFHGETSVTSHKHFLWESDFPKDVVILPYDDGGSYYYGLHGCDLLGYKDKFELSHRWELMDYWMSEIYAALKTIKGGKKKDLDSHARHAMNEYWPYMEKLCSLYKDTTIPKYLKRCDKKYKKLVKALKDGEREVSTLVDIVFGEGTWQAYYDYCARYRKAANKRAKVEALCARLGIASPYESSWRGGRLDSGLTVDQIRNLTAKERNELHFASIMREENRKARGAAKEKYNKNMRNAYKWIVGFEQQKNPWGGGYENGVKNNCVNKETGVVYECSGQYIFGFYWCDTDISFDYDSFRKSEDKEQWIANFYAKCKEVALNRKAILTLKRIKAHIKEKTHSYDDDVYLNDEYLRENTTEAEYIICSEFIRKQDKYFADEEARRRAKEIARLKREEEERKEREYQEKVKQEQIDECIKEGSEGCRKLWRKHLTSIGESEERYNEVAFN